MPTVVISRGSHSGGVKLAELLGQRLGWKVISQEMVAEAAGVYGVSEDDIVRALDTPPSFWERLTRRRDRYIVASRAAVVQLLDNGTGIYHGLGGQFLLQELPCLLRVRLIAPLEWRVQAVMTDRGLGEAEATAYIRAMDERRRKWMQHVFGVDWSDPALYDLVINLGTLSLEAAADLVVDLVGRREYRPTPECLQGFKDFALAARVRAELTFHSGFAADDIDVVARNGIVHLSGGRGFTEHRGEIVRFVRGLAGVGGVLPDLEEEVVEGPPGTPLASEDRRARDVMLPPEAYPTVHEWVTIREAIVALEASAVRLPDGHCIPPRYLLVLNEKDELSGIVSRRELLKGLVPQLQEAERVDARLRRLVPFRDTAFELPIRWSSLFSRAALHAARAPVGTIMSPVRGTVTVDDPLSTVITTMIHHQIDLVPVLDGKRVAGLVLMTEVFDAVAEFIAEHAGSLADDAG